MEAILFAIIITWAIKKAAEHGHKDWQGSKAANRRATRGQPAGRRSASAIQHDTAYWAHQVTHGFPAARHGLVMGWHTGRLAQIEGAGARARAEADQLELRARVTEAIRDQRRRQEEALARIQAAAGPEPETEQLPAPEPASASQPGPRPQEPVTRPQGQQPATPPVPAPSAPQPKGTNAMPADAKYTQQMNEYTAIRRDAEEELNSTTRKRMTSRLDILMSMGLDPASLSEAAAIDDALREQQKAAQQALDAADAAIAGLRQRHGGIKQAVDDAPVDKPADAEFYTD